MWFPRASISKHAAQKKHIANVQNHQLQLREQARKRAAESSYSQQQHDRQSHYEDDIDWYDEYDQRAGPTYDYGAHDNTGQSKAWYDADGEEVFFTAGDESFNALEASLARALKDASNAAVEHFQGHEIPLHDDTEDFNLGYRQEYDNPPIEDVFKAHADRTAATQQGHTGQWAPYPDKATFLTDLLFRSPRLRFSRAQQKAILQWARHLGATVPSHWGVSKAHEEVKEEVGISTQRQESAQGHVWYLNKIGDSIAKDISNPITRPEMVFYPEYANEKMSQVWHGEKMLRDVPDHLLTPMVRVGSGRIFYVNELVSLTNNGWFIPTRWFMQKGKSGSESRMYAMGHDVVKAQDGTLIQMDDLVTVPVDTFTATYPELLRDKFSGRCPLAETCKFRDKMPHPLREKAVNRPVYSIPVIVFLDDVSGNQSKQWNKHFSCYLSNGALPREKLSEEFHVRFVATSPHAAPLEIMEGVRSSIAETYRDPIKAYDCQSKEEVLIQVYPLLFAGDNPMQAELCSCSGLNSNYFCRTCKCGGTQEFKRTDAGYASLFESGSLRSSWDTYEELCKQYAVAYESGASTKLAESSRASGVKDPIAQPILDSMIKIGQEIRKNNPHRVAKATPEEVQALLDAELRKARSRGSVINPLLQMDDYGVDINKDTPTEILHTILLGVVKYFWAQTTTLLEKDKKLAIFESRLRSVEESGLNIPKLSAEYMCQYKGGLIGKHFKSLSQVMAFAVHDLVPQDVLNSWIIIGRLVVLLWHTEIENIDNYTDELNSTIDDFLLLTAKCSPAIIISKPKFHFLIHLAFYIRRFGPALLFSTERYESYNAVFRAASIHSNHQAPSRDIAWCFASMDTVKHIATGGWWKSKARGGKWVQASPRILEFISQYSEFAELLGLSTQEPIVPGSINNSHVYSPEQRKEEPDSEPSYKEPNQSRKAPDPVEWTATIAHAHLAQPPANAIYHAKDFATKAQDVVKVGGHVIARHEGGIYSPLTIGRVVEILGPTSSWTQSPHGVKVTVQLFDFAEQPHPILHMPVVLKSDSFSVLNASDILAAVNLQHDCHAGNCQPGEARHTTQEREVTSRTRMYVRHTDHSRYIVNMHAIHNHRILKDAIPPSLKPSRLVDSATESDIKVTAATHIRGKRQKQQEKAKEVLINNVIDRTTTSSADMPEDKALAAVENNDNLIKITEGLVMPSEAAVDNDEGSNIAYEQQQTSSNQPSEPQCTQARNPKTLPRHEFAFDHDESSQTGNGNKAWESAPNDVLKHWCRLNKVPLTGKKSDIVERLRAHFERTSLPPPSFNDLVIAKKVVQTQRLEKALVKTQLGDDQKRKRAAEEAEEPEDSSRAAKWPRTDV
ncbi:hypothetical protein CONPUDRAFT_160132 [Coniophora puteana RWD-64-598 SS2]|uniref:SAP domain-containing protein n=1 Tax=Coniophora puteana (strain RWD-64-598) TaxID=741705 RepID=R7SH83_CONPW|nr:uncharacterized protein CONPUDRAFT_160132 [Coniophora puteana RWD-64-598 SS2]EIW74429.1 hypothetical protein CONPUDRAFT_160132 [Coniophora puteana RWD-64-598 SS2]